VYTENGIGRHLSNKVGLLFLQQLNKKIRIVGKYGFHIVIFTSITNHFILSTLRLNDMSWHHPHFHPHHHPHPHQHHLSIKKMDDNNAPTFLLYNNEHPHPRHFNLPNTERWHPSKDSAAARRSRIMQSPTPKPWSPRLRTVFKLTSASPVRPKPRSCSRRTFFSSNRK
jgi:hypothetical protein